MKTLAAILFITFSAWSACTKITYPTDYSTVSSGTRANLKANFDAIKTVDDPCKDSVDEVRARFTGYTGSLRMSSLDHLMLRMDTDGSLLGRFGVLNGFTGDTLFRVTEDSTWKAWGAGVGTKLTLSDSILAATARISGNGTFGGTLGVTGASTLAALSATTGAFSSNATVGGTFAVSGQSTMAGLEISGGSSGAGRMYSSSSLGFNIQARTGSSYDFSITQPGGAPSYLLRVPTGTATIEIPGAAMVGQTLGVTGLQTNSEAIAFGAAGTSGAYRIFRSATNGLQLRGGAGSSYDLFISDASGNAVARVPTGTSTLQFPNASGVSITGPASFSSTITTPLTASLPVFTNGSSQLTTNAMTGTGSVMMSASPTTTGTLTGAAANFSGAVTASTVTTGGGDAFTYGDTSFTLTATGMTTSPTGTAYAVKVGNAITLTIPYITGTSNSTGFTLTGLPAGWRPTRAVNLPYSGYIDNGVSAPLGFLIILTNGTITLGTSTSTAGWTNSGTKAIGQSILPQDVCVSYQIQ